MGEKGGSVGVGGLGAGEPPTQGWPLLTLQLSTSRGDLGEAEGGGAQDFAAAGPRGGMERRGVSPKIRVPQNRGVPKNLRKHFGEVPMYPLRMAS